MPPILGGIKQAANVAGNLEEFPLSKQPIFNACFSWMIPNLYIKNGCFTKHLFINGCLGFQAYIS